MSVIKNIGEFTETIVRADIDYQQNSMVLYGQTTKLVIYAGGECCSESWFETTTDELAETIGFNVQGYEFSKSGRYKPDEYSREGFDDGETYENGVEYWNQYLTNVRGRGMYDAENNRDLTHYIIKLHLKNTNGEEKVARIKLHNASNGYYTGFVNVWVYGIDELIVRR